MTSNNTAWLYLVVSSDAQAESLENQREWAEMLAEQKHWRITEVFQGVSSGRDGVRGLLTTLLTRLQKANVSLRPTRVIMTRLDRLGRGIAFDSLAAVAEITKLGVIIHTRQDGDYSLVRASDSILPMMRVITGAIENEARRDKARSAYDRRRRQNLVVGTKRPYGLMLQEGHDVPVPGAAEAVKLAYELSLNGFGLGSIGTRLHQIAPLLKYKNGRESRISWTRDRVRKTLMCRSYRGTLIDPDDWDRVQRRRELAPKTRVESRHPWPLAGALNCVCGRRLVGSSRGSPALRVYRCNNLAVHSGYPTYGAHKLEEIFVAVLEALSVDEAFGVSELGDEADRSQLLSLSLKELEEQRAHTERERLRIWALNASGKLSDARLQERLDDLSAEAEEIDVLISGNRLEAAALEDRKSERVRIASLVSEAPHLWERATVDERRRLAQALAQSIGPFTVEHSGELRVQGRLFVGSTFARKRIAQRR